MTTVMGSCGMAQLAAAAGRRLDVCDAGVIHLLTAVSDQCPNRRSLTDGGSDNGVVAVCRVADVLTCLPQRNNSNAGCRRWHEPDCNSSHGLTPLHSTIFSDCQLGFPPGKVHKKVFNGRPDHAKRFMAARHRRHLQNARILFMSSSVIHAYAAVAVAGTTRSCNDRLSSWPVSEPQQGTLTQAPSKRQAPPPRCCYVFAYTCSANCTCAPDAA